MTKKSKIKLDLKNSVSFMYSEFACIVDYLILIYGKEKLILYIRKLSNNPDNNKEFKKIYGLEFSKAIQNFKNIVNANKKPI
jgi:hypothetical protein